MTKCGHTTTHDYTGPYVCEKERPCEEHGIVGEVSESDQLWYDRGAADMKARALAAIANVLSKDALIDALEGL